MALITSVERMSNVPEHQWFISLDYVEVILGHATAGGQFKANDQSKSGSPLFFPANTFARQGDCSARSVQFDVASLGDKKK